MSYHLADSLRMLHLPVATNLARGLEKAAELKKRRPLSNFTKAELSQPVGNGTYTLQQSLLGSHRAGRTSNRRALARNFNLLAPRLGKEGHYGLIVQLVAELAIYYDVEVPLDPMVQEAQANIEEEARLWRIFCKSGSKGVLRHTEAL